MNISKQFLRFTLVGIQSTLINYFFYILIYDFTENLLIASFLGYFSGLFNSFIFGKKWVFKNSAIKNNFIFIKFLMVYFFGGYLFSAITNYLSIKGIDHRIAWLIGISICTVNNFLGSKYIVFRK